ncbi:bzip transcription factor [Ophiostoma piceae UAMH 11346]|uniref:Bzip transcription factor n=1 Tax=Ophiostoma piceae (strain UAMH 11346) TaxID=1262450 RepID=S3CM69_OPHP1|nr:bzip transcription factor [Ophiostoma piceae UAMH 11346]
MAMPLSRAAPPSLALATHVHNHHYTHTNLSPSDSILPLLPSASSTVASASSPTGTASSSLYPVTATSPGSTASTTSPASASSLVDGTGDGASYQSGTHAVSSSSGSSLTAKETELQRKRARDRKSQQAMRDRTKWAIFNLNEQVAFLTQMLSDRTRDVTVLNSRMRMLETDNAQLRTQNAALQLSLMGTQSRVGMPDDVAEVSSVVAVPATKDSSITTVTKFPETAKQVWEIPPVDGPPTCLSDQILQGFIASKVHQRSVDGALTFGFKPNLCSLLEKDRRTSDAISDIVGDIVRSYFEIDTLPKQIAVFYIMCSLLKWMVLLDKASWDRLPVWLRPTQLQVTTPHAAWIDRIPWPRIRDYLIAHPDITLDHFAAVYSTSFSIQWAYDPSHVLLKATAPGEDIMINPVYEEHIRQLSNWEVGALFRDRYPDIAALIDNDLKGDIS